MKLFLQKNAKFSSAGGGAVPPAAGGFAPKPPASGGWGLRPQTPQTAPHCEFLVATRLFVWEKFYCIDQTKNCQFSTNDCFQILAIW